MALMARRPSKAKLAQGDLPDWLRAFLLHGTKPERDTPAWTAYVQTYYFTADAIERLWRLHRDAVRAEARALGIKPYGELFEHPDEAA